MGKVFFAVGISLDGFIAGPNGGPKNPLGDDGVKIHQWVYTLKAFRERLGMKGGETENKDNDLIADIFNRTAVNIIGKRMFDEGEANWPEEAPFHGPVYVITHQKREPWKRPGGTTFYFFNDGIEAALEEAKKAAGDKDIRISGGADVIQQYFNGGFIDEFILHIAPLILGNGVRLFEKFQKEKYLLEISDVIDSPGVTHLKYKVSKSDR